ncbi:MAG: homogentisate 1,2-dioxygenase [Elusimicrobia bacterium]|nr:homogentisate 1,2-dioxygenase [Elusimicrobiota bacterium]
MILTRGALPPAPHTEFRVRGSFTLEEIHGSYGFSGPHSRKVHLRSYPTEQSEPPAAGLFDLAPRPPSEPPLLQPYHLDTGRAPAGPDAVRARLALLHGPGTTVSVARSSRSMPADTFFRNGEKHELYFVQEGAGRLRSEFGELRFRKNHYLAVPKGTTYRLDLSAPCHLLVVESTYPIDFAPHHLNRAGQATLMAPVVETQLEAPEFKPPVDRRGRFGIDVKHGGGRVTRLTLGHHPFDLVGWEGALFPYAFDILNHHGIARAIHVAPPMHQTFQSGSAPYSGFSICSFVPQVEGWDPRDVPAPYAHSNVDSDECMFFANASYGARKGVIRPGSLTFHPGSLPHSPQGRAAGLSLAGRGKRSRRLAVMLDTFFESLEITEAGWRLRDPEYPLSWSDAARRQEAPSR